MVFSAWFYKGEIRLATLSTELRDFSGEDICPHWNITRRCLCHGRKGIWPLLTNKERVKWRRPCQSLSCLLATKCKCSVLGTAVTLGVQLMRGTSTFFNAWWVPRNSWLAFETQYSCPNDRCSFFRVGDGHYLKESKFPFQNPQSRECGS